MPSANEQFGNADLCQTFIVHQLSFDAIRYAAVADVRDLSFERPDASRAASRFSLEIQRAVQYEIRSRRA